MVILNEVVHINYNKMKRLLYNKMDEKNKNVLDNVFFNKNEKEKKYINYNIISELKKIMDSNLFIDLSMNYSYCKHIYKYGKYEGHICGAKIFIKYNDKRSKFLCSRHCRDYNKKHRKYSEEKPRCKFIRNNNKQCRHITGKHIDYCYIHREDYKNNLLETNLKNIEKLKRLRIIFFKNKNKSKIKYKLISKLLTYNNKFEKYFKNIIKIDNYRKYKLIVSINTKGIT